MPTAQVIYLDQYRPPTFEQKHLTKMDKIRQLLAETTPAQPDLEERLDHIERQLSALLQQKGGSQ